VAVTRPLNASEANDLASLSAETDIDESASGGDSTNNKSGATIVRHAGLRRHAEPLFFERTPISRVLIRLHHERDKLRPIELTSRKVANALAVAQNRYPVGNSHDLRQAMRNVNNGLSSISKRDKALKQMLCVRLRQNGCRLIENENVAGLD
jgi:hypothetical protein